MSYWFSSKTNRNIQLYYYGTSSRIVYVHFLRELKTPKRNFEINWPLRHTMARNLDTFSWKSFETTVAVVKVIHSSLSCGIFLKFFHVNKQELGKWLIVRSIFDLKIGHRNFFYTHFLHQMLPWEVCELWATTALMKEVMALLLTLKKKAEQ